MVKLLISAGLYVCRALDDQPMVLNVYTTGLAYDTAAKTDAVFTAEPYAGPAVKMFITTGRSPIRDPLGYELAMIKITIGCLITNGSVVVTFCPANYPGHQPNRP